MSECLWMFRLSDSPKPKDIQFPEIKDKQLKPETVSVWNEIINFLSKYLEVNFLLIN